MQPRAASVQPSSVLACVAEAMLYALGALITALSVGLMACGGPTFNGTIYRGQEIAFQIPDVPEGWRRIDVSDAAVAFRDDKNNATIAINGHCRDEDDVPLAALTQHLFFQFTEQEVVLQEVVPFDGREAMHTVMSAKYEGVPKKFDVWVLKKDGCVYDLIFIAHPGHFELGASAFERLVRGFATLPVDGHGSP